MYLLAVCAACLLDDYMLPAFCLCAAFLFWFCMIIIHVGCQQFLSSHSVSPLKPEGEARRRLQCLWMRLHMPVSPCERLKGWERTADDLIVLAGGAIWHSQWCNEWISYLFHLIHLGLSSMLVLVCIVFRTQELEMSYRRQMKELTPGKVAIPLSHSWWLITVRWLLQNQE